MPNHLDSLLNQVSDPKLREDLRAEIKSVTSGRDFGLVFEKHLPELIRLRHHKVKRGETVQWKDGDPAVWRVVTVDQGVASLTRTDDEGQVVTDSVPVEELVVVREFSQPIYPGLTPVSSIQRGTHDQPTHVVINGENYHALETLLFTLPEAVDLIYIDPPYNTGKDSWVYNDKYVDKTDSYRHSLWLSFMERRLQLAKQLLKPTGIILISIDDTQHARLKILCDQIFGEKRFIASMVWKSKSGGANDAGLAVDHEYILAYGAGDESIILPDPTGSATTSYNHSDENGRYALERLDKQNLSYSTSMDYDLVGPDGTVYKLEHKDPANPNATWRWGEDTVKERMDELVFENGCVYTKNYEKDAYVARSLLVDERFGRTRTGGTNLKNALGQSKQFDYPKPVKLIEYLLGITVGQDALVLDFFGGSGTTLEAVMSANAKDGGTRQCVLVTNNELSKKQATALKKKGVAPGTDKWEAQGVFYKVTLPRITAAATGVNAKGVQYSDGFEANVAFFNLTYQERDTVSRGKTFDSIAPLLWLRAGATGSLIDSDDGTGWMVNDTGSYGVLFDTQKWRVFSEAINSAEKRVGWVFIVTDSESVYQQIASELPPDVDTMMLYSDYLSNFEINTGGSR